MTLRTIIIASLLFGVACSNDDPAPNDSTTCPIPTEVPKDVAAGADQAAFDAFSWQSFLAVNGAGTDTPAWGAWSSTADYLNLVRAWDDAGADPTAFPAYGARFYPPACLAYCTSEGIDCTEHRTLETVGKVDDAIFEANATGLSADPVIAANGTFLRYEIRINRDMYDLVTSESLYRLADVTADNVNGTCGAPDGAEGIIDLKLAWMDLTGFDAGRFYTEPRLVHTPASARSDGQAACELVTMGLVGMHIAHKTTSQPNWVWSTFEHVDNAPDCGAYPTQSVNTACPSTVDRGYNFYGDDCQPNDSGGACQSCNVVPAANSSTTTCANGFCVDQAPLAQAGRSRLCRQVPVTADGPLASAFARNVACQSALPDSVWANYMLISTQWFDWSGTGAPTRPAGCTDVADDFDSIPKGAAARTARANFAPQIPGTGSDDPKPVLANTSMESYERSNCMGCHGKAAVTNATFSGGAGKLPPQGSSNGQPNTPASAYVFTDFAWWLSVEVPVDGL